MYNVIGPPPSVVPDLVAGIAQADGSVAIVAGALAGEAESHGGLVTLRSILPIISYGIGTKKLGRFVKVILFVK